LPPDRLRFADPADPPQQKTRRSFPATQVGFPDLRIKKPIPGRPEIGAQFQPWIFSYTTRAPSSKKRVSRVRIAPGACTALTPERPSASQDIALADEPNKLRPSPLPPALSAGQRIRMDALHQPVPQPPSQ